jgi:hypothetical protein
VDVKVSNKERRLQPDGPVEVLIDGVFDLHPVFGDPEDENLITDIEILDDAREELLDRAAFAVVKQRGLDPIEPLDGVQWEEYLLDETPAPVILQQVAAAVAREGPGVQIEPEVVQNGAQSYTIFHVKLTNTA